ncbi:unnamed protein product [Euphydryas editha]|uniref:Reverse transcriptase n=1 Tax=Euphydryas editha TaxID=104508 RepID=A0AAU9V1A3_EUPED|nr:unnamed protein product [Euphydryas editha]
MATYGAPVWADRLTAKNKAALRAAQRTIAVRVIRGYCTVSWAAATALAGDPTWELVLEVLAETYSYVSGRRALVENPTLDGILRVRQIGQEALMRRWGEDPPGGVASFRVGHSPSSTGNWQRRPQSSAAGASRCCRSLGWTRRPAGSATHSLLPAERPSPQRALYWWSAEIAGLRAACNGARRQYTRSRRRPGRGQERQAAQDLRGENEDPAAGHMPSQGGGLVGVSWGSGERPLGLLYNWARNKLRAQSAPISETLQPEQLVRIVGELFPDEPDGFVPPRMARQMPDEEDGVPPPVTETEMEVVITRLQGKKRAPGPDGVHRRVLAIAFRNLGDSLRELFDRYMRSG